MGKILQGILGGFKGKVGPLTGSSWKGIQVIKSRPTSVAYPGTAAQVAQTSKMTGVVALAKALLSQWIKPLFDRFAIKQSGYNVFTSRNLPFFPAGLLNDPTNLVMSEGSMLAYTPTASGNVGSTIITVTWDNAEKTDPLALGTDVAYACVMKADGTVLGISSGSPRSGETIDITTSENMTAVELTVFLAFKAANGLRVSNAAYAQFTPQAL